MEVRDRNTINMMFFFSKTKFCFIDNIPNMFICNPAKFQLIIYFLSTDIFSKKLRFSEKKKLKQVLKSNILIIYGKINYLILSIT